MFSANTLHVMSWDEVQTLFRRLSEPLAPDAKLAIYGPFNYGGRFTSPSNEGFDATLKAADARRGIRDFEHVDALAGAIGLRLIEDRAMPTTAASCGAELGGEAFSRLTDLPPSLSSESCNNPLSIGG